MPSLPAARLRKTVLYSIAIAKRFLGLGDAQSQPATPWSRVGLASAGLFFVAGGIWIVGTSERLPTTVPVAMMVLGILTILVAGRRRMSLAQVNILSLTFHMSALLAFYFLTTRFLTVTYSTDTIIGTYAGLDGVLRLQNPYVQSIKPFLDQFSFPPSFYTPRVDGSFEFRLNYPAFNFLSLIPLYVAGLHDLRDGVMFFHIASLVLIFGLVPPRSKAISLAPFAFGIPLAVVFSWTDSVWAFLLLLSTVFWHRDRRLALGLVGLAGATKQIALFAAPFVLIRLWHETDESKTKRFVEGSAVLLMGFILPNLPFIIASPSSWWAGTIAAYLPGNAPQVAAGVGLSEILLDLGVSTPSYVFLALMGIATVGALYLYHRRFARYEYFMWVMPALPLFFYYRAFPNYMVFWLIPLLPELLRFKPGGVRWNPGSWLRRVHWPPSLRVPTSAIRTRTAPSMFILVLLAAVLAGVSGAYISKASGPKVEVQVNLVSDPDGIGSATLLEATLTNRDGESLSPTFFVKWYFLPFLWIANSTSSLPPDSTRHYTLTATDALAAIPRGTQFKVLVFDSLNGELVAQSQTVQAELPVLPVSNPHFKWWTLDSETGRRVPFAWKLLLAESDQSSGIKETPGSPSGGIQLRLNYTLTGNFRQGISIWQRISYEASRLRILVLQSPSADQSGVLFGARIRDGTRILYYVFSSTANERSVKIFSENTTITIPIGLGQWTWVPIDALSEWTTQGWPQPKSLQFSIFLEGVGKGSYYAYVGEVS